MNPVDIIWSMVSATALTLGAIHLVVWFKNRHAWSSLAFTTAAFSVSVIAMGELTLMYTSDHLEFGRIMQWIHVPVFTLFCGFVFFIHLQLGGRLRWAISILALRLVSLIINFAFPPNINYQEIVSLRTIDFLGIPIFVVYEAVRNPFLPMAELTIFLTLAFTFDAMRRSWRQREPAIRRKALVIGGTYILYVVLVMVMSVSIHRGLIQMPYFISIFFLAILLVMGYELSRDVIEAALLSDQHKENLTSMNLAARAAHLAMWSWDINRDEITVGEYGRKLYGVTDDKPVNLSRFLDTLHPEDRMPVRDRIRSAMNGQQDFEVDYRVVLSDGTMRWISARGSFLRNGNNGKPTRLLGVSMDVTARKRAEEVANLQREELAHISRVTTMGELSGALAHELNQPLAIVLSNAQAAQRLLDRNPPDLDEVRNILADIVREDRRAGDVIRKMRDLLRRGETKLAEQNPNSLVEESLTLMRIDLLDRGVTIETDLSPDLPLVMGDRVQLQQVILNLLRNACDAVLHLPSGNRTVSITSGMHLSRVFVAVRDHGRGIDGNIERIFQPYFTTKSDGLGMGLSICRSIIQAHHGWLWAENHPQGGAVFHMELPAHGGEVMHEPA